MRGVRCPQLFYRYVPRGGDQLDMAGLAGFLQEFMPDLKRSELNFFKVNVCAVEGCIAYQLRALVVAL